METRQIHAHSDSAAFARQLAAAAECELSIVREHRFPDRESLLRVAVPVAERVVLVRSLHDPNAKLITTLLAADALRRAGARKVDLVAPYLPYMRQDRVFRSGEPLSQCVIGEMLAKAFDRVLTIEPHLHRVTRLSEVIAGGRSVSAAPALSEWVVRSGGGLVVGPDVESNRWVRSIARKAGMPWVVGEKRRAGDRSVRVEFDRIPAARRAVVVDDIASTGATLAATVRELRKAGIRTVDVAVVHAIFAPGALARIRAGGVRRIVSCDTIPHQTNRIRTAQLLVPIL